MSRFASAYSAAAHALLGSLIVFALLNAALYLFPAFRADTAVDTPIAFFGADRLLPAYPGWTRDDLIQLHEESRVVFDYQPIVQFRVRPLTGRFVNAVPQGFRVNAHQAPWPPSPEAYNVFVFGGSTTFGWLLADGETIVSQLQDRVAGLGCRRQVAVYNFGQPSYISTQEALFFQSLVMAGTAPDVAVFIDGFNDFFFGGEMSFTQVLRGMMDDSDLHHRLGPLTRLPAYQFARRARGRLLYRPPVMAPAAEQQLHQRVIAQWLRNKQLIEEIGRGHAVKTAFVWQPVPVFEYDLSQHFLYRETPLPAGVPPPNADVGRGYGLMATHRQELEAQGNFLWLADMQAGVRENLYVDRLHYNAVASAGIAGRILDFLKSASLLECAGAS